MSHITEYFPRHVWGAVIALAGIAAIGLFVPPSVTGSLGLSLTQHIIAIGFVEFSTAVGIGALVVAYRDPDTSESEWKFDP